MVSVPARLSVALRDEWRIWRRCGQVEAFARIDAVEADPTLSLETQAA